MLRRLHPIQPDSFAFTPENLAWAQGQISKYPEGRQASAIIPLLWRAQEQHGWLTRPAIEYVASMLGMAYIRALEVATFYFMFQLAPVGSVAHIQICGTTSCMICGAEALIETCQELIAPKAHMLSVDGKFSWEEVECLGACTNAPMAQIGKDYYEDLTPTILRELIAKFSSGDVPRPGPQNGRFASEPKSGLTSLEVLASDRHVFASGEFTHAGKVDGKVWCTVSKGNMRYECGIRVDLTRRDVLVVVAQAFLKGLDGHVDGAGLLVGLGRAAPHHDEALAVVFGAEVFDVCDEGLSLGHLVGDGLDAGAVEALYPALIEDGIHGNNAFKFGRDGAEIAVFKHAGGAGGLKSIGANGIPAAEHKVAEIGQRHELADERVAVLVTFTQSDVGELAERANGDGMAVAGGDNASNESGGDGAHTGGENPKAAGGRSNGYGCVHA